MKMLLAALLALTPVDDARSAAARMLEAQLDAPPARLTALVALGQQVLDVLEPGHTRATLAARLQRARWRAVTDPIGAHSAFLGELRELQGDLTFRYLAEAPLPEGFPRPIAVGEIEIKSYPRYRMARAEESGTNGAFGRLFGHIQGNRIPMTAPVEVGYESSGADFRARDMAFLYATAEQGSVGPAGSVDVVDVEAQTVVSLGCRGGPLRDVLTRASKALHSFAEQESDWFIDGELRTFSYNSPMVPDQRRYFEVQLPIREVSKMKTKIDFKDPEEGTRWNVVNDGVMGGLSSSHFALTEEGTLLFEGSVSLENNGGFASVRSDGRRLGLADAVVLRVRGDGKSYKFRVRTSLGPRTPNYEVRFETRDGSWSEHRFEARDFRPVWRGQQVRGAPELELADVVSMGLLISDGQAGPFRLELDWIGV